MQQALEVAVRQAGVADLGDQVLVGDRVQFDEGGVVGLAGLPRVAGHLRLDPVEQGGGHLLGDRHPLLAEVLGDHRAGRPVAGADVGERDAVEVAGRVVVVDDRVKSDRLGERVPAGLGLAVDHHDRVARLPDDVLDGDQVEVQDLDHGPVLGPADEPVAGDDGRLAEPGLDQVGQPEHAAEAVRVGLDVGDEDDPIRGPQPGEEPVRPAEPDRAGFAVGATTVRVGAATRHGGFDLR